MERWRDIADWPYQVSNEGRVRNARTLQPLKLQRDKRTGYTMVSLKDRGRVKRASVHRLVCIAFNGPPPPKAHAAHDDGDQSNNRADNLFWRTPSANNLDKARHGTARRGERNFKARLTEDQVRAIRDDHRTEVAIGRAYGISPAQVGQIRRRACWAWLD